MIQEKGEEGRPIEAVEERAIPEVADASDERARVARWAEAHGAALQAWARRLVRDRAAAEDVVQETFVVALERADAAVPAGSERAWLFGIARRLASRALRARRGFLAWLARVEPDFDAGGDADGDGAAAADARAIGNERRVLVAAAIAACPARQREVLYLVFHEGLTLDRAAHAMGVSPGAARRHYHRAKAAVRARLEGQGVEP